MTENELKARLVTYMGGRAAEEIIFDSVTTGASNDIEQATKIARAMVTQYGMSDRFGLMGLVTVEDKYLDGRASLNCGEETAAQIDQEVMKILKASYDEAVRLLQENRDILDEISKYLYEHETITGKEFMQIFRRLKGIPEPEENADGKAGEGSKQAEKSEAENAILYMHSDLDKDLELDFEEDEDLEVDTLEEPLPEEFLRWNVLTEAQPQEVSAEEIDEKSQPGIVMFDLNAEDESVHDEHTMEIEPEEIIVEEIAQAEEPEEILLQSETEETEEVLPQSMTEEEPEELKNSLELQVEFEEPVELEEQPEELVEPEEQPEESVEPEEQPEEFVESEEQLEEPAEQEEQPEEPVEQEEQPEESAEQEEQPEESVEQEDYLDRLLKGMK